MSPAALGALAAGLAALVASGCGGRGGVAPQPDAAVPDCTDADGDGYGAGADCRGPDCDEADAARHDGCAPNCAEGSTAPGCPCPPESVAEACYEGPPGTVGVGQCQAGLRLCRDGRWSACEGQVIPDGDVEWSCDYEDDDCDGTVDEGVMSACGDCNGDCHVDCAGVGCVVPFQPGPGTARRDDGALLAVPLREPPDDVWIAMGDDDTVLRVDGPTRTPVGRYRLGEDADDAVAVAVVVDGWGRAYALEMSPYGSRPGAVVAIAPTGCPDRDGDGAIATSTGQEALLWGTDECVAWRAELETCDAGGCSDADALVLTEDGAALWVSLSEANLVVEVDTAAGSLTGRSFAVDFPRPLVTDGAGTLWVGGFRGWLQPVPLDDPFADERDGIPATGHVSDLELGLDGALYAASPLARLDAAADVLVAVEADASGLVVDSEGDLWSASGAGTVSRWAADLDGPDDFDAPSAPRTLALDRAGAIWAATEDPPAVVVLDPAAGARLVGSIDCNGCLAQPMLAGDPTGIRGERLFGPAWARGEATTIFTVDCGSDTPWFASVSLDVPSGSVRAEARTAWDAEGLADAPWRPLGVFPPETEASPDDRDPGGFLEIRLQTLEPDTIVERLDVIWACIWSDA